MHLHFSKFRIGESQVYNIAALILIISRPFITLIFYYTLVFLLNLISRNDTTNDIGQNTDLDKGF